MSNAALIDAACLCAAARGTPNEPRCAVSDTRRWVDACDSVTGPDELADLVNNLHLPESTDVLKTIVCSNLADTAQYSEAFARRVVDAQALPAVATQLCTSSSSPRLAAAALLCLGQVAKHNDALAAEVLEQGVAQATLEAAMSQVPLHDFRL
jgi:predicted deacylase